MSLPNYDISDQTFEVFYQSLVLRGYFKRTHLFYLLVFLTLNFLLTLSIFILLNSDSIILKLLDAVLMAFVTVQFGILGHDFAHGQVFKSLRANKFWSVIMWGIFAGLSESKWFFNHNEHHKEVNHSEHDPDMEMPFIFTEEQITFKSGSYKKLRKYQHLIFFMVLPLIYPIYVIISFKHLFDRLNFTSLVELFFMVIHYVVFLWLVLFHLPAIYALPFLLIYAVVTGAYMGLVFAPNHKGMPMIPENEVVLWWHQIVCTRNLYPNIILFHMMGGLDYQIEHHLFTAMSRNNYPKVAPLVKQFCFENNLPYHETTWTDSMKEIYLSLKVMSKKL